MDLNHSLSYSIKAMFERKHFDTIASTHKYGLEQADHLDLPLLITANMQTDPVGRRKGTSWLAPAETSLLATFFLPHLVTTNTHNLAQLLACSMVTVLKKQNHAPLFKWPNDLLLYNKKLGGAMADIKGHAAIVSCALNVNTKKEDLEKVDIPATSLLSESGKQYSIDEIIDQLALQFASDLIQFNEEGFAPFAKIMNASLAYKDHDVKIKDTSVQSGKVKEIAPDGRLIVTTDGKDHLLSTGSLHSNY